MEYIPLITAAITFISILFTLYALSKNSIYVTTLLFIVSILSTITLLSYLIISDSMILKIIWILIFIINIFNYINIKINQN